MSKICWIIGASHGIGEALAKRLQLEGYSLAISARSFEKLEAIKQEILLRQTLQNQQQILVTTCDVADFTSLHNSFDQIMENFGRIDLAIFCSALYQPMSAIDFDLAVAKETMEVNFNGFLNFLHLVIPQMQKQKGGHIAAIASVAGYSGLPKSFAYGASKAAMINLCEGIYGELKQHSIALSVINPGFVETRLTKKNRFHMPCIISSDKAAQEIIKGLKAQKFEIHFPKKFTIWLKILRLLPYFLKLRLIKRIS